MLFLVVGAGNTLLTYAVYCLLVFVLRPQLAYGIVFVIGIALAYFANSRWVFNSRMRLTSAIVYPLVYLAQYAMTSLLIHFLMVEGVGPRLALALALIVTTPLSFVLNYLVLGTRSETH